MNNNKKVKIVCQLKRNKPPASSPTDTYSPDLQNNLQVHLKLSNLKKHPTTVTLITYQMKTVMIT